LTPAVGRAIPESRCRPSEGRPPHFYSAAPKAEIHRLALRDGDVVLLCTDGLTELVEDVEIAGALARFDDPDAACKFLVVLAVERGGPDDITVTAARYFITPEGHVAHPARPSQQDRAKVLFAQLAERLDLGDERGAAEAREKLRKLGWELVPVKRS
jgi:serine/threonine protein phosphatase PrpC